MEKQVIRLYFSGYIEKEIYEETEDINKIYEIKEALTASLTPEEVGCCMTEDDWQVYP
jgi:CRISPR/Cas system-associated endonuclease Cas3-HD